MTLGASESHVLLMVRNVSAYRESMSPFDASHARMDGWLRSLMIMSLWISFLRIRRAGVAFAPSEKAPSPSPLGWTIMMPNASHASTKVSLHDEWPGLHRLPPTSARIFASRHCRAGGTAVP